MGRGGGRPVAAVVLSAEERAYLERQVRRHRIARSMAERCRMILRCAAGLPNKVAAELGVHEHTVGKWRRRFVKDRVEGLWLVPPLHGEGERAVPHHDSPDLDGLRLAAAPRGDVSPLRRSAVRRESPGHHRALSGAAGSGGGALCGRKESDSGPRPRAAGIADAAGHGRAAHPYLCPAWHNLAVRGP